MSLCLESGNATIFKGGSEAAHSNRAIFDVLVNAIESIAGMSLGASALLETREEVSEMLKLDEYINLLIPRGSNEFVKYIQDNTRIPVLGHSAGIDLVAIVWGKREIKYEDHISWSSLFQPY